MFLSGEEGKGRSGGVEEIDGGGVEEGVTVRSEERRDTDERVR